MPEEKYFPKTVVAGNLKVVIVNEVCGCTHARTQHYTIRKNSFGHGPCSICACRRFTWRMSLVSGTEAVEKYVSGLPLPENCDSAIEEAMKEIERLRDLEEDLSSQIEGLEVRLDKEKAKTSQLDYLRHQLSATIRELLEKVDSMTLKYKRLLVRGRAILIEDEEKKKEQD